MSNYRANKSGGISHVEKQAGITRLDVPGWVGTYLGKRIWYLDPYPTRYMTMTASVVTLDAFVPIPHRLVRVEVKHVDASNADNSTSTAYIFSRIDPDSGTNTIMDANPALITSEHLAPFGEGWEYSSGVYRFSANTTATHRIYPSFYIQELLP